MGTLSCFVKSEPKRSCRMRYCSCGVKSAAPVCVSMCVGVLVREERAISCIAQYCRTVPPVNSRTQRVGPSAAMCISNRILADTLYGWRATAFLLSLPVIVAAPGAERGQKDAVARQRQRPIATVQVREVQDVRSKENNAVVRDAVMLRKIKEYRRLAMRRLRCRSGI